MGPENSQFLFFSLLTKNCPDLLDLFQKFITPNILIQKLRFTYQNKGFSVYYISGKFHLHQMKFEQ